MTTPSSESGHDGHVALGLSDADRVDYLKVVASVAFADQETDEAELGNLRAMCEALGLSDAGRDQVLAAAAGADAAATDAIVTRLKADVALRVPLLTDVITVAFADGKVAPAESRDISRLGRALDIESGQIGLIARYVEAIVMGADRDQEHALSRELGAGVAAEHRGKVVRWLHRLFRRA
ncbi:MAG: TerB family tellurite resistance protein [Kofleriaceae bacterium]|nr:TerB family tellurite resistance protein [Myxococcales bacterium]MCB9559058.1 TerB family tellurite resistance protein [Kofleriaceae bacterium]